MARKLKRRSDVKLQEIVRKNGTKVYLAYLPKNEIVRASFFKGDYLRIESPGTGVIIISKRNKDGTNTTVTRCTATCN